MGKYSMPGVYTQETDLSEIVKPLGSSKGVTVGKTLKGIASARTLFNYDKDLIDVHGKPDSDLDFSLFAGVEFLKESDTLYFTRVVSGDEDYANVSFSGTSATTFSGATSGIDAVPVNSLISNVGYEDGNKPNDIYELESVTISTKQIFIASIGPGSYGNNVGVEIDTSAGTYDWEQNYDSVLAPKVFKIKVFVKGENDTTWPSNPIESFLVTRTDNLDNAGNQLQMEQVINGISKYIYVRSGGVTGVPGVQASVIALSGGLNSSGNPADASINSAWNLYKEKDVIDVDILVNPKIISTSGDVVFANLQTLISNRLDCISVNQVGTKSQAVSAITSFVNGSSITNPSYHVFYAGYDKIYNNYKDKMIYIPKAIYGGSIIARTENIAGVEQAPAGINRGIINSLGQYKVFTKAEIGSLYDANINTSKNIRGIGTVMWGQKTTQRKSSALDRINVRRLLLSIEGSIEPMLLNYLFELNNDKTRLRVSSTIDGYLRSVNGLQNSPVVVCDKSNNTPYVIDSNELKIDIYIQPDKVIEVIKLNIVVTKSGVNFSELM